MPEGSRFDFRNSTITNSVQGLEEPQRRYSELARERVNYVDGVTNLFRWEDISPGSTGTRLCSGKVAPG